MTVTQSTDRRARADENLRRVRKRIRQIRKRTAIWSIAIFMAVWGTIFSQLVSGGDPGLAGTGKSGASVSTTRSTSTTGSSAQTSTTTTAPQSSSSSSPSPVTTSQS